MSFLEDIGVVTVFVVGLGVAYRQGLKDNGVTVEVYDDDALMDEEFGR